MGSDQLLVFRGRALRRAPELPLLVYPQSLHGGALELTGGHAQLVAQALQLASLPGFAAELAAAIAERCTVEPAFARELLDHLLCHGILLEVVPAAERLQLRGDRALGSALRLHMKSAVWPSLLPGPTVWSLGALGSPCWRESFRACLASGEGALTWSVEGNGVWIGPGANDERGPCPGCLLAWRTAVEPATLGEHTVVAYNPAALSISCQQLLLRAEAYAAKELTADEVLYVTATQVSAHTLLRQPGCPDCAASSAMPPTEPLEAQFLADLADDLEVEPSAAQRAPYLDPLLGPIELAAHDAPGLFRGLPLALGSLRMLLPREGSFERREMFSVTFGVGMTEAKRQLVSFAEGIERYALSIDPAHVVGKRFSELGVEALSPAETVRFAAEQFSGKPGAPIPYEDQRLDWSWAYDFTYGGARLLAHDVFTADRQASPSAIRWVGDPFSSGAAAHRSLPRAVRRALLELVERDALMLAWYLRLPLQELDLPRVAAQSSEVRELYDYLTERGIELRGFDLRVDIDLPTVLLTARARVDCGQWRADGRIVSPSAAGGWNEAIAHSLHEILGHYSAFALVAPDGDSSLDPVTGEPHLWWANFASCFEPRQVDPLSFLGNGTLRPVPSDAALESVDALLGKLRLELRARQLSAFIHYLAPEAVRKSGLVAVRACIPGLVRMTPSRETVNFGEPRVEQIRARWDAAAGLNEHPHPIS